MTANRIIPISPMSETALATIQQCFNRNEMVQSGFMAFLCSPDCTLVFTPFNWHDFPMGQGWATREEKPIPPIIHCVRGNSMPVSLVRCVREHGALRWQHSYNCNDTCATIQLCCTLLDPRLVWQEPSRPIPPATAGHISISQRISRNKVCRNRLPLYHNYAVRDLLAQHENTVYRRYTGCARCYDQIFADGM